MTAAQTFLGSWRMPKGLLIVVVDETVEVFVGGILRLDDTRRKAILGDVLGATDIVNVYFTQNTDKVVIMTGRLLEDLPGVRCLLKSSARPMAKPLKMTIVIKIPSEFVLVQGHDLRKPWVAL